MDGDPKNSPILRPDVRLSVVFLGWRIHTSLAKVDPKKLRAATNAPGGAAGKERLSTPEKKKQRTKNSSKAFSTAQKGTKESHQYPNFRIPNGKGLPMERLAIEALKSHHPRDDVDGHHLCQVCLAVGPRVSDGTYRNTGITAPRANLFCSSKFCVTNFCSAACWNWWHIGEEFPVNE